MTGKDLKKMLDTYLCDVMFSHKGIDGSICTFARDYIAFKYGKFEKVYASLDELMSDAIFDGKSLDEETPYIDFDESTFVE